MEKVQGNTFREGINKDMNPVSQPENSLTDVINGTILTGNGNEYVMQNDMGNTSLVYKPKDGSEEPVLLSDGYFPIGVKEYGDVLYIASTNNEGRFEIGSFPSPDYENGRSEKEVVKIGSEDELEYLKSSQIFGDNEIYAHEQLRNYCFTKLNPLLVSYGDYTGKYKAKYINKKNGKDITNLFDKLNFLNQKIVVARELRNGGHTAAFPDGALSVKKVNEDFVTVLMDNVVITDNDCIEVIPNVAYIYSVYNNRLKKRLAVLVIDLIGVEEVYFNCLSLIAQWNERKKIVNCKYSKTLKFEEGVYYNSDDNEFFSTCSEPTCPLLQFELEGLKSVEYIGDPEVIEVNIDKEKYRGSDGKIPDYVVNYTHYLLSLPSVKIVSESFETVTEVTLEVYSEDKKLKYSHTAYPTVIDKSTLLFDFADKVDFKKPNGDYYFEENIWDLKFYYYYIFKYPETSEYPEGRTEQQETHELPINDISEKTYPYTAPFVQNNFGIHNSFYYDGEKVVNLFSQLSDDINKQGNASDDEKKKRYDSALEFLFDYKEMPKISTGQFNPKSSTNTDTLKIYAGTYTTKYNKKTIFSLTEANGTDESTLKEDPRIIPVSYDFNKNIEFDKNKILKFRYNLERVLTKLDSNISVYDTVGYTFVLRSYFDNYHSLETNTCSFFPSKDILFNANQLQNPVSSIESKFKSVKGGGNVRKFTTEIDIKHNGTVSKNIARLYSDDKKIDNLYFKSGVNIKDTLLIKIDDRLPSYLPNSPEIDGKHAFTTCMPIVALIEYNGIVDLLENQTVLISGFEHSMNTFFEDEYGSKAMIPGVTRVVFGTNFGLDKNENMAETQKVINATLAAKQLLDKDQENLVQDDSYANSTTVRFEPKEDVQEVEFSDIADDDSTQLVAGELLYNQSDDEINPCDFLRNSIKEFNDKNTQFIVPKSFTVKNDKQDTYQLCYAPIYNSSYGYSYCNGKVTFDCKRNSRYAVMFYTNSNLSYSVSNATNEYCSNPYLNLSLKEDKRPYAYCNCVTDCSVIHTIKKDWYRHCVILTTGTSDTFDITFINDVRNVIAVKLTDDMLVYDDEGKEVGCWLLSGQAIQNLRVNQYPLLVDNIELSVSTNSSAEDFCQIDYLPLPFYEIDSIEKYKEFKPIWNIQFNTPKKQL